MLSLSGFELYSRWVPLKSWHRCHMWIEFVVGSLSCFERFLSGYKKIKLPNSNTTRNQVD